MFTINTHATDCANFTFPTLNQITVNYMFLLLTLSEEQGQTNN